MYDAYNNKLPNRVQVLALKYVIFTLCMIYIIIETALYIFIYTYMHTHIYAYTYICACAHTHVCVCAHS